MKQIKITKHLEALTMTASDWELFDDKPGAETAAREINQAITVAFNYGGSRSDVRKSADTVMEKHRHLGAGDTEPRYHLDRILNELFGEE